MARRSPALLLLILACGFFAADASADSEKRQKEDYYELYKVLVDTIDQVERNYVKEVDRRELMEAAIEGVLGKLDPYSTYINPNEYRRFQTTVQSRFGGIGIQVSVEGGRLTIISPLVGTPAYRAGLLAGDRIVKIEGESTEGITLDEAVRRLKGEPGTDVTITVIHSGAQDEVPVTITRENIHIDTVLGDSRKEDDRWDFMLKPQQHIGYLRVTAFSRDTAGEMRRALEELNSAGLRGLILDLRFNPGGLLRSAIEVSDLFISQGRIVSTSGRNSPEHTWKAEKAGTFEGFPMVVLVNRYSASEIVSACLQDHDRAVIMGERTWGKGSVQNVIELEIDPVDKKARSALKLTTASYRRPSGKNIHRFAGAKDEDEWGVTPNDGYELKLKPAEIREVLLHRRQRDIVRSEPVRKVKPDPPDQEPGQPQEKPNKEPEEEPDEEPDAGPSEEPDEEPGEETNQQPVEAPDENADDQSTTEPAEDSPQPEKPAFVDRQLQMAIDYLSSELARAD